MPKIVRSTDELIENNITGALIPASGTTAQRPGTPTPGMLRYNTTTPGLEVFVDADWSTLAAGGGLGDFVRRDGDTMVGTLTFTNGFQLITDETGPVTAPAITFATDLDTGIYRAGANIVGIAGQGTDVARFDGSIASSVNYITFASSITANAPIISNDGADTNGVGLGLTITAKAATAAGNGGPLTLTAGLADTTGVGGALIIAAGASAGASGTAGSLTIDAGAPAGGAEGAVTIAGTNGTLTLGSTVFPVASTALGALLITTADTLTDVEVTTGGVTVQMLQFDDNSDTFSWIDKDTLQGFSTVTGDSGTANAELDDSLLLSGATSGGITTLASDDPEVVTFSITPTDLATTIATIVADDFFIVGDSADASTVIGQKATFTQAFDDLGVAFTGGTIDAADYLLLAGGTLTGALVADDATDVALPDIAWTGDLDTGIFHPGADRLGLVTAATIRLEVELDGTLNVAGTANYEALVTADDDIPNKKFVDDEILGGWTQSTAQTTDGTAAGTILASAAMASSSSVTIQFWGIGYEDATGDSIHFEGIAGATNEAGTSTAHGFSSTEVLAAGLAATVKIESFTVNDGTDVWEINITGEAAKTIDWTLRYRVMIIAGV